MDVNIDIFYLLGVRERSLPKLTGSVCFSKNMTKIALSIGSNKALN